MYSCIVAKLRLFNLSGHFDFVHLLGMHFLSVLSSYGHQPLTKHAATDSTDHTVAKKRANTTNNVLVTGESSSMSRPPEEAASIQINMPGTMFPTEPVLPDQHVGCTSAGSDDIPSGQNEASSTTQKGMNDGMAPSVVDAFKQGIESARQIQACNCLNSVSHQNVADDENSNTPEVLILLMDAFGYSAEEILCRKQFASFFNIFKKIVTVSDATCEFNLTGSASQGFTNSLYSVSYQSDLDYVTINSTIKVINNQQYLKYKQNPFLFNNKNGTQAVFRVEEDQEFPGYVKLLHVLPVSTAVGIFFPSAKQYFSSYEYRLKHQAGSFTPIEQVWEGTNGPARTTHWFYPHSGSSLKIQTDFVPCLEYKTWPHVVHKWAERSRPYDWPSKHMVQKIKQEGCYLAPVGHFDSKSKDIQWRLSFCGEKLLFSELKPVHLNCFVALRLILKGDISRINEDVLSSFHMKNVVYWCAERSSCAWTTSNFENCLKACIKALTKFVSSRKFPNYFIVGRNMFNSKMTSDISFKILELLQKYNNNIYEIMSLDSLSFLKSSTLYQRPALELAVQKSVIHACIVAYSQIVSIIVAFHFNIWNVFTSLDLLECLQMANQLNHSLKSEKQHYLSRHILRSYIHSILGFLNYACYKTFGQNEYLPAARKHLIKSMAFSNIALMCRAATFFFMESDLENCLKICTAFFNYPVTPQFLHQQVFEFSRKVCQTSFDLIDESDITLLKVRKKQLMSMFFCTGGRSCCDFANTKSSILSTLENLTYIIFKDMYFHVIYTRVESIAVPEVIQYELHSLSTMSSVREIYLSPFLNCCLLAFLCYHENRNFDSRDEILNRIDEYLIKCTNRTDCHDIAPGIKLHEPVHQIANIAAYCHLKAKHYRNASKFFLESMTHFPLKRNAAYGYIRCVIQNVYSVLLPRK